MAETNDIIFNVGTELDTTGIQRDIRRLANQRIALKMPVQAVEAQPLAQQFRKIKSGQHERLMGRMTDAAYINMKTYGMTPTEAVRSVTAGGAGLSEYQKLKQSELVGRVKQREVYEREQDVLSIIEQNTDGKYTEAQTDTILEQRKRLLRIPEAQRTESQKKIVEVGNDLVDSLKDTKNTFNKQIGALSSVISAATIAYKTAMAVYSEATRESPIGFEQALNPAYSEGINIWLAKMGMSEDQAKSTQREMTRFVTDVQFGRRGNEIEALAKYGVGDIYRTMLSGASMPDKVMSIQKSLSRVPASKRLALASEVPWLGNIMTTLPYAGLAAQELPQSMEEGKKREDQVNIALANRLKGQRVKYAVEATRSENKRLIEATQIGAGTGAALMALKGLAAGSAGGPLGMLLGAGVGGLIGALGGGAIGAAVDTGFRAYDKNYYNEDLFSSKDELFDYSKPMLVQDVSQREITINNTFQVDSENVYNQTTHHLISNAETGVM